MSFQAGSAISTFREKELSTDMRLSQNVPFHFSVIPYGLRDSRLVTFIHSWGSAICQEQLLRLMFLSPEDILVKKSATTSFLRFFEARICKKEKVDKKYYRYY